MSFEHCLMEFLLKLKSQYGETPMIKTIELHEDFYKRVECELMGKCKTIQPNLKPEPCVIKFFYYNEIIQLDSATKKEEVENLTN